MKRRSILSVAAMMLLGGSLVPVYAQSPLVAKTSARETTAGYREIDRFLRVHRAELSKLERQPQHPRWQTLNQQLDKLCRQRDCYASHLYWYTDLDLAKQAAQASGKPILSLRLLGNLDEELSCANSRFFRIALYSNPEIAKLLREKYILHWQSVRPVPKLTIDFGDGRKIQQTITGNSIHYILDRDGKPLEALPGLYAPQAFQRQLEQIATFATKYHQLPTQERRTALVDYHQAQLTQLQTAWQQDLERTGVKVALPQYPTPTNNPPTAIDAAPIAVSKMAIESPILRRTRLFSQTTNKLKQATDDPLWVTLGDIHRQDAVLAANSQALMRRKQPQLTLAGNKSEGDSFARLVDRFQNLIAIDSIRNEYLLHSQLHQWLMTANYTVDELNAQVYERLFLTPNSDRWLGLMPEYGYTGIESDGITVGKEK
jgi:hypothetical protein